MLKILIYFSLRNYLSFFLFFFDSFYEFRIIAADFQQLNIK